MTMRTKSRGGQWVAWGGLAIVALAAAAVWSRLATGSFSLWYFRPSENCFALPFFVLFVYLGWELRWDGVRRGMRGEVGEKVEREDQRQDEVQETAKCEVEVEEKVEKRDSVTVASTEKTALRCAPTPTTHTSEPSVPDDSTGEALFDQARALLHQMVPDFENDGPYLELLGKSAAAGYAPASAKLGEYAMRRAAWVEAYYWMAMAKRQGMYGLANVMREIRRNWSQDGFPVQSSNVNQLFTLEAGSIGRALLSVDSGYEAYNAREFLKANHPEFLS